MSTFNEYARYYDLFYNDKNYTNEAKDVISLLENYKTDTKSLLIVGCGTGKHDREIAKLRDYNITGMDLSQDMVDIAKSEAITDNLPIDYFVGDSRNFETGKQFDTVISLFHVMSYQRTNDDIKNSFKCISNSLNKGGIFIFDSWYGPGVVRDLPSVRVKTVEDDKFKFIRTAVPDIYPNENAVDVNYHICAIDKSTNVVSEIDEKHPMRYYFKNEISEYLLENGLELIECLDCNTLKEPTFDSWTAYFICKKL